MKNVIFFDFDGTIVNCKDFQIERLKTIMLNHNVDISKINFLELIGPPLVNTFEKYIKDEDPKKVLLEYNQTFSPNEIKNIYLFDGIKELLNNLKQIGYKICIASLQVLDVISAQLKYLGIEQSIDSIFCDSPEKAYKSKTQIVREILDKKLFSKKEILVVGDTVNDVLSGKENGVDTVGVSWGYGQLKKQDVTYLVHNTMQLFDLLKQLKSDA